MELERFTVEHPYSILAYPVLVVQVLGVLYKRTVVTSKNPRRVGCRTDDNAVIRVLENWYRSTGSIHPLLYTLCTMPGTHSVYQVLYNPTDSLGTTLYSTCTSIYRMVSTLLLLVVKY